MLETKRCREALLWTTSIAPLVLSSFYRASVANASNVLQPYWLIVLPLDVPDLTASLLLWGPSGQRWRCLWIFLFFACSKFRHSSSSTEPSSQRWKYIGEKWPMKFCLKMPDFHVTFRDLLHGVDLRHGTDGFTSPPKEDVLRIFFALKNPTASVGFQPANLGTKGQHGTSRPPKPLGPPCYVLSSLLPSSFFFSAISRIDLFQLLAVYFANVSDATLRWP